MSCSRIYNDYDGVTHDYTRKRGLIYEQVFLPEHAPKEWSDRSILWNAVEEAEKTKDSRLSRELVIALPVEFDLSVWELMLKEYINRNFVNRGNAKRIYQSEFRKQRYVCRPLYSRYRRA